MASDKNSIFASGLYLFKVLILAAGIGALASLLTIGYLFLAGWGESFFEAPFEGTPYALFWPLILLTIGGVLIGLTIKYAGEHIHLGSTQKEFSETKGRLNYRHLPSIITQCILSLWAGASIGPEGGLADLGGGASTLLADKLKIRTNAVIFVTYCGVAGSFGSFFGSPLIGAFVAMEYLFIQGIPYVELLVPGLISATVGFLVYYHVFNVSISGILIFPPYASPLFIDLLWALLIGVIGGFFGAYHQWLYVKLHKHVFIRFESSPIKRGLIGGLTVGFIGSFVPLLLYSGQNEIISILFQSSAYSFGFLLLLMFGKSIVTALSFNTVFKGGPVFPYLFMGGTMGLAITQVLPFIPQGVAVTAGMAAIASALFPLPISVILLVSLMSQINLIPTITIASITGFLLSRYLKKYMMQRAQSLQEKTPTAHTSSSHENT
ncbi:MAG: chloride channel protein [Candidatus Bathyarchaeota archaeon]|nr:chloride channel protein [Candidatus Bathyarchaeota archaeon]